MRICFISSEVFFGGRRGGFGRIVRLVGTELARRGHDVSTICWAEPGLDKVREIDGIEILSFPYDYSSGSLMKHLFEYAGAVSLIKRADADVYLSIDAMVETYLAQKLLPTRRHVIWAQDPFDESDYELLGSVDKYFRYRRLKFWATASVHRSTYANANLILTQAKSYVPKLKRLFHVDRARISYLPNPVETVPDETSIRKSHLQSVCFLGRMDPQKRYWIFFQLARKFPDIAFTAMGGPSRLHLSAFESSLEQYAGIPNLRLEGFVNETTKSKLLSQSWILVLPSVREGLPLAFLEALSHKCALLSSVNPDGIVDRFGAWAAHDDFERGLRNLLEEESWRSRGEAGFRYVNENHSLRKVTDGLVEFLAGSRESPDDAKRVRQGA